jgi:hypothetical protein
VEIHLGLHFDADREWNRVEVGQHSDAAAGVHMGKVNRRQVEAFFGESAQVFAFCMHPCAKAPPLAILRMKTVKPSAALRRSLRRLSVRQVLTSI